MRISLLIGLVCLSLAGCSAANPGPDSSANSASANSAAANSAAAMPAPAHEGLPPDTAAEVTEEGPCPYLDSQWLADTNGQRMTHQGIDTRFDTPACIFWSYPPEPQATVIVRHLGSVEDARAAVDWAAPIHDTEPVSDNGWEGGRGVLGPEMSVYAVQKDTVAVLVWTNQAQTLKAELIAQETIKNLGL